MSCLTDSGNKEPGKRRSYENRMGKFIKCSKIEVIKLRCVDLKLEKIKSPGIRSFVFIGADERNVRALKNLCFFTKIMMFLPVFIHFL